MLPPSVVDAMMASPRYSVLNPILGAASGALSSAWADAGINDAFMKDLAANLDPGKGALFVQILEMTPEKALKVLSPYGGVLLKSSID